MRSLTPFWSTRPLVSDFFRSDLWSDMDRMIDDFYPTPEQKKNSFFTTPTAEVHEKEGHYLVTMDLPGMKMEDIQIEVIDNTLTVSGERKRNHDQSTISFKRSLVLPEGIEAEKIEAHYDNGVLELDLPKSARAQARKIQIQSGKSGFFDRFLGSGKASPDVKDVKSPNRAS